MELTCIVYIFLRSTIIGCSLTDLERLDSEKMKNLTEIPRETDQHSVNREKHIDFSESY